MNKPKENLSMRRCYWVGDCIFHKWIERNGELYGLLENLDGMCSLVKYNNFQFVDSKQTYTKIFENESVPYDR